MEKLKYLKVGRFENEGEVCELSYGYIHDPSFIPIRENYAQIMLKIKYYSKLRAITFYTFPFYINLTFDAVNYAEFLNSVLCNFYTNQDFHIPKSFITELYTELHKKVKYDYLDMDMPNVFKSNIYNVNSFA